MSVLVPSVESYSVGIINDTAFQGESAFYLRDVLD